MPADPAAAASAAAAVASPTPHAVELTAPLLAPYWPLARPPGRIRESRPARSPPEVRSPAGSRDFPAAAEAGHPAEQRGTARCD